jgi:lysophospholipase L1-like esterase
LPALPCNRNVRAERSVRLGVPSGETTIHSTERLTIWFGRFALTVIALSGGIACGDDATSRRLTEAAAIGDPDSLATGSGARTAAVDPAFPQPGAILAAPRQLLASALSLSQVRLSWKDASGLESGFEIYRSTAGSVGPYSRVSSVAPNITKFTNGSLSSDRNYCYRVRAAAGGGAAASPYSNQVCTRTMAGSTPIVRVVTFGDSNTDWGLDGTSPEIVSRSYLSLGPYLSAMTPHGSDQLAAKIESKWRAVRSNAIRAVNHGISGTTTGGGGFGGPNRHSTGAPHARTLVGGVTRFEGEVLGLKWPWSGGEPVTTKYTDGAIRRVQAFTPAATDFAYVSMGTNDPTWKISTTQTLANLRWMIDRWRAAGRQADHFLLTTLAPRTDSRGGSFPALNDGIRTLAASQGVVLIDLANHTSADNGLTWRSSSLHVGDGVHYSEPVRDWIAAQIVAAMRTRVP